jgi:spermidine synthase
VIPWTLLAEAALPGGERLRLKRRGEEFSIMLGANELMNSRISGSERALAVLACGRIGGRIAARMLIGGLGMGFTLRAALDELAGDAEVTAAELVPAVIDWARGPMAAVFAGSLDDPRVAIHAGDVGALIRSADSRYDAILLDVDNGPEGLTFAGNNALYGRSGLAAARRALTPGGVLAVWSAGPDVGFARRLHETKFAVEEHRVRAHDGRGARHVIWLAVK